MRQRDLSWDFFMETVHRFDLGNASSPLKYIRTSKYVLFIQFKYKYKRENNNPYIRIKMDLISRTKNELKRSFIKKYIIIIIQNKTYNKKALVISTSYYTY